MSKEDIMLYLERKMRGSEHSRRNQQNSRRNRERYSDDYGYEDNRGYPVEHRHGETKRARAPRGEYYEEDYEDSKDYADEEDYHKYKHIKLTKSDISKWEKMLHNADGTHGPHYSFEQAVMVAEKIGIRFDAYSEREFHMCLNMMYADYCVVVTKHTPPEKVLHVLAELAKAFFDDPDGPEPSEKLALYFHCVASADE